MVVVDPMPAPMAIVVGVEPAIVVGVAPAMVVVVAMVEAVVAGGTEPVTGIWLFFDLPQPPSTAPAMARLANRTLIRREDMHRH